MLCAKFGLNWLSGSGENVKSLQTNRQTTDNSSLKMYCFSAGEPPEIKEDKKSPLEPVVQRMERHWSKMDIVKGVY